MELIWDTHKLGTQYLILPPLFWFRKFLFIHRKRGKPALTFGIIPELSIMSLELHRVEYYVPRTPELPELNTATQYYTGYRVSAILIRLSCFQEPAYRDLSLLENFPQCTFRHITRVVGNSSISVSFGIKPYLMATGRLSVKPKSKFFQFPDNLPVFKPRQPAHQVPRTNG